MSDSNYKHFNKLRPEEAERLAVLIEECSEVQKAAAKILRHGYSNHNPHTPEEIALSNRDHLALELGDLEAIIFRLKNTKDVDDTLVVAGRNDKLRRGVKYMHHIEADYVKEPTHGKIIFVSQANERDSEDVVVEDSDRCKNFPERNFRKAAYLE